MRSLVGTACLGGFIEGISGGGIDLIPLLLTFMSRWIFSPFCPGCAGDSGWSGVTGWERGQRHPGWIGNCVRAGAGKGLS